MQKLFGKYFLSVTLLFPLLTACLGTTENAVQASLTGAWQETAAFGSICDGASISFSEVTADLVQTGSELSGSIKFLDLYDGTEVVGKFEVEIKNKGQVTGEISLRDRYGNDRTYEVALKRQGDALTGTFTDRYEQECSFFGDTDTWVVNVTLLRRLTQTVKPDGKEPNNTATIATPITVGESLELTLSKGDVDWFTFNVAKASTVKFDLGLLTALKARVWLLQEGQTPANMMLRTSLNLEKQELEAQVNQVDIQVQLAPGKYYLAVTGLADENAAGNHEENGKYKLSFLSSEVVPDADVEPNDKLEQATPLTQASATFYHGYSDVDWYTFTLEKASVVRLGITTDDSSYLESTLFDHTQTAISGVNPNISTEVTLKPGNYLLKVKGNEFDAGGYTLEFSRQDVPDAALEPNDTFEQATLFALTTPIKTYVFSDEQDWFTFTLPEVAYVEFSSASSSPLAGFNVTITLLNEELQPILESSSNFYTRATLNPGKYYFKIAGISPANLYGFEYSMRAPEVKSLGEGDPEPNDKSEQAMKVDINTSYSDYYLTDKDRDWFTFTLEDVSYVNIGTGPTPIVYKLENGNLNQLQGNFGGLYNTLLQAGVYYVELTYPFSTPYGLTVTAKSVSDSTYEPNNSPSQATPITSGFNSGRILVFQEEDWFRFTLTAPARVDLKVIGESPNIIGDVRYELYDSQLLPLYLDGALKAGAYYIKVYDNFGLQEYNFTFSTSSVAEDSYEPNNSLETASLINTSFDQELFLKTGDEDWFKFVISEARTLEIRQDYYGGQITVRRDFGHGVFAIAYSNGSGFAKTLEPGTYYVSAEDDPSPHKVGLPYHLKISE
jgi:hypothetical protein